MGKRWRKWLGWGGSGLALALGLVVGLGAAAEAPAALEGRCVGNHDGDTLRVLLPGGHVERVRLLGVDTPELDQGPWAEKARAFTSRWVHGQPLRLTLDRQPRDRHHRLLAYVWVGERMLNLALVEAGLATTLDYAPNHAHAGALAAAQAKAQAARLGIWQATGGLSESPLAHRRRLRGQPPGPGPTPSGGQPSSAAHRP